MSLKPDVESAPARVPCLSRRAGRRCNPRRAGCAPLRSAMVALQSDRLPCPARAWRSGKTRDRPGRRSLLPELRWQVAGRMDRLNVTGSRERHDPAAALLVGRPASVGPAGTRPAFDEPDANRVARDVGARRAGALDRAGRRATTGDVAANGVVQEVREDAEQRPSAPCARDRGDLQRAGNPVALRALRARKVEVEDGVARVDRVTTARLATDGRRTVRMDGEVAPHRDDCFACAVHDLHRLDAHHPRVRIAKQLLRLLASGPLDRRPAATGSRAGA